MTLHPCGSCPYRCDVPSGVWAESEYEKLPLYDAPTGDQPFAAFFCHQQTGALCSGWVGCHDMGENIGLRLALATGAITEEQYLEALDYVCSIELWESGQAARDHGVERLDDPDEAALRVADKLTRRLGDRLD